MFALLVPSITSRAHAASFTLTVEPGATCLERGALEDALVDALGPSPISAGIAVEVVGSAHDPRSLVMRVHHPDQSEDVRTFSPAPERCEHLHKAVALALALAIKAAEESVQLAPPAPPARPAAPPPPSAPVRPAKVQLELPSAAAAPREPRLRDFVVGVAPSLATGLSGSFAGGGRVQLALALRTVRIGISGAYLRSVAQQLRNGQYTLELSTLAVDVCGRLALRQKLEGLLCAAPLFGLQRAEGLGLRQTDRIDVRFWGGALGFSLVRKLTQALALNVSAQLLFGHRPLQVVVRNGQQAIVDRDQLPSAGGVLHVGLEYRFAIHAEP